MKQLKNRFSIVAVLALGHLLSSSAFAVATLRFSTDGGTTFTTCADINSGCDANGANGAVTFVGPLGNFSLNVVTGVTSPAISPPAVMDLNSVNVVSAGGGSLIMEFSQIGFTLNSPQFRLAFGGTIDNGGSVTANAWVDTTNTLFGHGTLIGSLGPFAPVAFSGTTSGAGNSSITPYALTQRLTLTFPGAGNFSGNFSLSPVPEPSSVALGIGMLVFSATALRRKIQAARQS